MFACVRERACPGRLGEVDGERRHGAVGGGGALASSVTNTIIGAAPWTSELRRKHWRSPLRERRGEPARRRGRHATSKSIASRQITRPKRKQNGPPDFGAWNGVCALPNAAFDPGLALVFFFFSPTFQKRHGGEARTHKGDEGGKEMVSGVRFNSR